MAAAEQGREEVVGYYKELHKAFGFTLGVLTPLVGVKYEGSLTNLINEHSVAFNFFLGDASIYATATLIVALNPNFLSTSLKYIFLVSGITACQLILFIAVTSFWWFLGINAFGFMGYLIFAWFSNAADGASGEGRHGTGSGDIQMPETV